MHGATTKIVYFLFAKVCREGKRLKNNTIMFVTGLYILYVLWTKWEAVFAEFHFGSVQYMPNHNSACLSQAFTVVLVILFRNSFALWLPFPTSPVPRDYSYMASTLSLPANLDCEYRCRKFFPNFWNTVHFHVVQNLLNKININNDFILSSSLSSSSMTSARWWTVSMTKSFSSLFQFPFTLVSIVSLIPLFA
jgi:hypothetical protein